MMKLHRAQLPYDTSEMKKTTFLITAAILCVAPLTAQEVLEQPTATAVAPHFVSPESLLKQRVHTLRLDGSKYRVELLKVGDVRTKVKRISDQKEFEIPLSMLSKKQKTDIRQSQILK